MNLQASVLLTLTTRHPYFSSGSADQVLQLGTPLGDHVPRLNIRPVNTGFVCYGQNLNPNAIQNPILIPINTSDSLFLNYTNLDLSLTPSANVHIQPSNNYPMKVIWLTSDMAEKGNFAVDQINVFPVQHERFSVEIIKNGNDPSALLPVASVSLKSSYGTTIDIVPPVNTMLNIDLSDKPKGLYNLTVTWVDGTEETYTFVALDFIPSPVPLAILRLFPEQLVAGYPDDITGLLSPTYQISFTPRAVIWNYYLVNISEDDFNKATMTTSGAGAPEGNFLRQPGVHTLPNGTTAYLFSSDRPIALRERYDFRLQFSVPDSILGDISFPFPSAGNVQIVGATEDSTEPDTAFVDVFVHF